MGAFRSQRRSSNMNHCSRRGLRFEYKLCVIIQFSLRCSAFAVVASVYSLYSIFEYILRQFQSRSIIYVLYGVPEEKAPRSILI